MYVHVLLSNASQWQISIAKFEQTKEGNCFGNGECGRRVRVQNQDRRSFLPRTDELLRQFFFHGPHIHRVLGVLEAR